MLNKKWDVSQLHWILIIAIDQVRNILHFAKLLAVIWTDIA